MMPPPPPPALLSHLTLTPGSSPGQGLPLSLDGRGESVFILGLSHRGRGCCCLPVLLDTRLCGYDVEGEREGVLTQKGEGRFLATLGMALLGSVRLPQTLLQQSKRRVHKRPHVGFAV